VLALTPDLPEGTDAKPRERQRKRKYNRQSAGRRLPGVKLCVFADDGQHAKGCDCQKQRAGYFKPQLMKCASESARGRFRTAQQGIQCAAAPSVVAGNSSRHSELS
jgi:hypothetical protein